VHPGETHLIPTGMAIHISDPGLGGPGAAAFRPGPQARHRAGQSGRTDRQRLSGRTAGLVLESGSAPFTIAVGERIAQLVIVPVVRARNSRIVPEFTPSERGAGGFGHSGRH
jgi:dUTP pyrophosphatase